MEGYDKIEYRNQMKKRLRQFTLNIIKLSQSTKYSPESKIINNQYVRSGSSVYANYRAACRARSDAELYSKMCIVVEEADETEMWLDILIASEINNSDFAKQIYDESLEILKIMASAKKKLKG